MDRFRHQLAREALAGILVAALLVNPTFSYRAQAADIVDRDGDGIADGWAERYGVGSGEGGLDRDFDWRSALEESLAGTDPDDPDSRLEIKVMVDDTGVPVLEWETIAHKRYQIQVSHNLESWSDHLAPFLGDGTTVTLEDVTHTGQNVFYRLKMLENLDGDEDGLSDWEEAEFYGTKIGNPDTDNDLVNDGDEVWAGTDPDDPLDTPMKLTKLAGDQQVLDQREIAPEKLLVRLTEANGTPVAGKTVEFRITQGNGTVLDTGDNPVATVSAVTGGDGYAEAGFQAGIELVTARVEAWVPAGGAGRAVFNLPIRHALKEDPPRFSHDSGVLDYPIWLQILGDEDATIHYTMDGSEPTTGSPVYDPENPILVKDAARIKALATYPRGGSEVVSVNFEWPKARFRREKYVASENGFYSMAGSYYPQIVGVRDFDCLDSGGGGAIDAAGDLWVWGTGHGIAGFEGPTPAKISGISDAIRVCWNKVEFLVVTEDGKLYTSKSGNFTHESQFANVIDLQDGAFLLGSGEVFVRETERWVDPSTGDRGVEISDRWRKLHDRFMKNVVSLPQVGTCLDRDGVLWEFGELDYSPYGDFEITKYVGRVHTYGSGICELGNGFSAVPINSNFDTIFVRKDYHIFSDEAGYITSDNTFNILGNSLKASGRKIVISGLDSNDNSPGIWVYDVDKAYEAYANTQSQSYRDLDYPKITPSHEVTLFAATDTEFFVFGNENGPNGLRLAISAYDTVTGTLDRTFYPWGDLNFPITWDERLYFAIDNNYIAVRDRSTDKIDIYNISDFTLAQTVNDPFPNTENATMGRFGIAGGKILISRQTTFVNVFNIESGEYLYQIYGGGVWGCKNGYAWIGGAGFRVFDFEAGAIAAESFPDLPDGVFIPHGSYARKEDFSMGDGVARLSYRKDGEIVFEQIIDFSTPRNSPLHGHPGIVSDEVTGSPLYRQTKYDDFHFFSGSPVKVVDTMGYWGTPAGGNRKFRINEHGTLHQLQFSGTIPAPDTGSFVPLAYDIARVSSGDSIATYLGDLIYAAVSEPETREDYKRSSNFWGSYRIAAGSHHNVVLSNGELRVSGDGTELGNGTGTLPNGSAYVTPLGLPFAAEIDAGGHLFGDTRGHSLAVDKNSNVWAWGDNSVGQLGAGNTASFSFPIQVQGVSGGGGGIVVEQTTSRVESPQTWWGGGQPTPASGPRPSGTGAAEWLEVSPTADYLREVKDTADFVVQDTDNPSQLISLGVSVAEDGTVWQQTTLDGPIEKVDLLDEIVEVDACRDHAIALRRDGEVFVWSIREGGAGILGDGTPRFFDITDEATSSTIPEETQEEVFGRTGIRDLDDYDGDGEDNITEVRRGTNAFDPGSHQGTTNNQGSGLVGTSDGAFSVGTMGDATYRIPIKVPRGGGGSDPTLSLDYHSKSGNGPLGVGWTVSGFDRITRGGSNPAKDVNVDPVDFDGNDWFYLSGQRLVAVNGDYGDDGTEYRLENDNQSKIVSFGTVGDGPAYFKVWTKSGEVATYGASTSPVFGNEVNARSAPPPNFAENFQNRNGVVSWHLNEISDRHGNGVHIQYREIWDDAPAYVPGEGGAFQLGVLDPLEVVPHVMVYGTNRALSRGEVGFVRFEWEQRPDVASGFSNDYALGSKNRLKEIVTGYGALGAASGSEPIASGIFRRYQFEYTLSGVTKRSLLRSVQEVGSDGQAFRPLAFDYSIGRIQPGSDSTSEHYLFETRGQDGQSSVFQLPIDFLDAEAKTRGVRVADLNGDTFPDIIRAQRVGNSVANNVYLQDPSVTPGNGDRFVSTTDFVAPAGVAFADGTEHEDHVYLVDLNADGRADILRIGIENGEDSQTWINDGSGFVASNAWTVPVERSSEDDECEGVALSDIDGDSYLDVLISFRKSDGTLLREVYRGSDAGLVWDSANLTAWRANWGLPEPLGEANVDDTGTRLVDLNGDGLVDVLRGRDLGNGTALWTAWLNKGTSTGGRWEFVANYNQRAPTEPMAGTDVVLIDYNGDGLSDLLYPSASEGNRVYFNTGHGWRKGDATHLSGAGSGESQNQVVRTLKDGDPNLIGLPALDQFKANLVRFGDVNGDGYPDELRHLQDTDPVVIFGGSTGGTAKHPGRWASDDFFGLLDINGDGLPDIISRRGSRDIYLNRGNRMDLLVSATDGLGAEVEIDYRNLNESVPGDPLYTMGTGAQAPYRDYLPRHPVVYQTYTKVEGGTVVGHNSYRYGPLLLDVRGHGLTGFAWVESKNHESGRVVTTEYRQDYPFNGMPSRIETHLGDGTVAEEVTLEYETVAPIQVKPLAPMIIYPDRSVQKTFEGGQENSRVTKDFTVDGFGNTTRVVETTEGNGETRRRTIDTVFLNNVGNWIIGRPQSITTTYEGGSFGNIVRQGQTVYDTATGDLLAEIVAPGTPAEFRKDYSLDEAGNRVATTLSGANAAPRTSHVLMDGAGRFPRMVTNAVGHIERMRFDPVLGVPLWTEDANGLRTQYEYDGIGRPMKVVRPDGTTVTTTYAWETQTVVSPVDGGRYQPANKRSARYKVARIASGVAPQILYFDTLGRAIRQETVNGDGRKTLVDVEYDAQGRTRASSLPFFPGDTPEYSVQNFDVRGMPTLMTNPDGTTVSRTYQGYTTTIVNEKSQQRIIHQNAAGEIVRSIDDDGEEITYGYDAIGNLREVNTGGQSITMTYDAVGRRTAIHDPSAGATATTYNGFGEVIHEVDAKNQVVEFRYDDLGRLLERTEPEGLTTWAYDSAPGAGLGQIAAVNSPEHQESFAYDALGRVASMEQVIGGVTYRTVPAYDELSRLRELQYPTGFAVAYDYTKFGNVRSVSNADNGKLYWEAGEFDVFNNLLSETLGNGAETDRTFDPETGLLTSIQTTGPPGPGNSIQDLAYDWDPLGNFTERHDRRQGKREVFGYDSLNRLTSVHLDGNQTLAVAYNPDGSILSKSDTGTYSYNGPGPWNAVKSISGAINATFEYDANGNQTRGTNGRTVDYTSFNKPHTVTEGPVERKYFYGNGRQVIREERDDGQSLTVTNHVGGLYENELLDNDPSTPDTVNRVRHVHHIRAGSRVVAVFTEVDTGGANTAKREAWLHRDHLGSVVAVTDEVGEVQQRFSYDAFGKGRLEDWSAGTPPPPAGDLAFDSRGYTGHLATIGSDLIHMGGRMYDSLTGRFLSPDPFIQSQFDRQNFNRYSYVLNNPLTAVDPSGYSWKDVGRKIARALGSFVNWGLNAFKKTAAQIRQEARQAHMKAVELAKEKVERYEDAFEDVGNWFEDNWREVVVIIVQVVVTYYAGPVAGGAVAGGLRAALYGGDTKDILVGAAVGAAKGYISGYVAGAGSGATGNSYGDRLVDVAVESVGHGVVDGVAAEAQGGEFNDGFESGAKNTFKSGAIPQFDFVDSTTINTAANSAVQAKVLGNDVEDAVAFSVIRHSTNQGVEEYEDRGFIEESMLEVEHLATMDEIGYSKSSRKTRNPLKTNVRIADGESDNPDNDNWLWEKYQEFIKFFGGEKPDNAPGDEGGPGKDFHDDVDEFSRTG